MGTGIIRPLERILDGFTMYTVVLYGLFFLLVTGAIFGALGFLFFSPIALCLSAAVISVSAIVTHHILAHISKAPASFESTLITALILSLILTPTTDITNLIIHACIASGAIVLKYTIAYRHRHICNPAALALVIAGVCGYIGVEWWIGSRYMVPFVLISGVAIVVKTRRFDLVSLYIVTSSALVIARSNGDILTALTQHFFSWPTIFFATVMLTEPLSLPGTKILKYIYVIIIGIVGSIPFSIGSLYGTPELALVLGNIFTFVAGFPVRAQLRFTKRIEVGNNIYEYHFQTPYPISHTAGQFFEWTLPHQNPDNRGIRRYLTISSAPHDSHISFAVKHVPKQSTWKQALEHMKPGDPMYVTQLSGDFSATDPKERSVWIAGGIGITPYMSMIRDAVQSKKHLNATLLYCNTSESDIAFADEIAQGGTHGLSVIHFLVERPRSLLVHEVGFITPIHIQSHVQDWQHATFYISGPPGMVASYEHMLLSMGVPSRKIITDYFPGLA